MARTYRRLGCRYDYLFVLWEFEPAEIESGSLKVRQRLAHFHSDHFASYRKRPPKCFRAVDDRKLRLSNRTALRNWVRYQDFELILRDSRRCLAWQPM
ncbi:hypothetical protein ACYZUD_11545 [Pseudomonas sp. XS1P51]